MTVLSRYLFMIWFRGLNFLFFPQKRCKNQSLDFFFCYCKNSSRLLNCWKCDVMNGTVSAYWKCETGPPIWSSNALRRHYAAHASRTTPVFACLGLPGATMKTRRNHLYCSKITGASGQKHCNMKNKNGIFNQPLECV